ncbi:MAG: S49 family peptidase [Planctomycetota bacterium]
MANLRETASRCTHRRVAACTLGLVAIIVGTPGCKHPIRALVGGGMNIGGNMGVNGDIAMTGEVTTVTRTDNTATPVQPVVVDGNAACGSGRIAIVDVDGLIVNKSASGLGSMGENPVAVFREKIRRIESDASISAVVVRINTPGGGVTASDILAHDLARLKSSRGIPVVACLMTTGCGGGYYLASHADHIVAHSTSVVGGIGVILNAYNMELALEQQNIISIPVKAGPKIDTGTPERVMEDDERQLLQAMANEFHQRFIAQVRQSRAGSLSPSVSLNLESVDAADDDLKQPDEIFDGRVMSGDQALAMGLVDATGYLDDAISIAGQMAGLPDNAAVVLLRRDNDRALSEFDVTPNAPMQSLVPISFPGIDRASMPTFLYLWQPDPKLASQAG